MPAKQPQAAKPAPTQATAPAPKQAAVPAPTQAAVPAPTQAAVPAVPMPAVFYGVAVADLTKSQRAIASAKRPAAAPSGMPGALRAGKPYRVGTGINAQWWAAAQAAMAAGNGAASAAAIVAAGCPPSMLAYLYRRGYVAAA
jgi:outer membrane biosynthesis protein TonB